MSKGRGARSMAWVGAAGLLLALSGCGSSGANYDIGPIFPLSPGKCAKYHGTSDGTGVGASCWVTKDECEQAAADWANAMQTGGVSDAIDFRC